MKLNQDNIRDEDIELAILVKNHIIANNFVIGNPALSLKKELVKLEDKLNKEKATGTDWEVHDVELIQRIALVRAGITGEDELTKYIAKLLKYEPDLFGVVAFASLSYGEVDESKDYVPDTDVILVYGKNILIIDAKYLKLKSKQEIFVEDTTVFDSKGKEIISYNSSIPFWYSVFADNNIAIDRIDGLVCIVNNTQPNIIKDDNWKSSEIKLVHISELKSIIKYWVNSIKTDTLYLDILTEIAKAQVREDESSNSSIDYKKLKQYFGV